MKKRRSLLSIIICIMLAVCACASEETVQHKTNEEKKLEGSGETAEDAKEESESGKKAKWYQAKLDAIEPSAYRTASGLKLEAGSYFSVIGKGSGGEYWEQVKKGAEQAADDLNKELGFEGSDKIRVTYSGPATAGSVDEQVNILDEELARYPVGVSISIADTQACGVQFDLAAENGIPVVAFDSGSDYPGLMATVSTDNRGTAQTAADRMAEFVGSEGEVLVFIQDSKSMSARERETGFVERLKDTYPGIKVAQVYYMDQMEEMKKELAKEKKIKDPEEIKEEQVIDEIMKKHPDIKGVFASDGTAVMTALRALERAGMKSVALIGYDSNQDELEALRNGEVDGLIVQNPFGMGYASVIASARASLSMGNEAVINTGSMWITRDNLDSEEAEGWLGTGED